MKQRNEPFADTIRTEPMWEQNSDGFAAKDILIEKLLHRIDFLEAEISEGKTKHQASTKSTSASQ
jgi:hypothetical protein